MSVLEYKAFHKYLEENDPEMKNILQPILVEQEQFPDDSPIILQLPAENRPPSRRGTSPACSSARSSPEREVKAGPNKFSEMNEADFGGPCPTVRHNIT